MKNTFKTSVIAITAAQTALTASVAPLFASTADQTGWDLLEKIEVEENLKGDDYQVTKLYPSELKDGVDQFDLTGYVVITWSEGAVSDFILISDMGFCPFCGNPEHGTALEVSLANPTALEDGQRITLRGALETVKDPLTTQSVRLTGAKIITE